MRGAVELLTALWDCDGVAGSVELRLVGSGPVQRRFLADPVELRRICPEQVATHHVYFGVLPRQFGDGTKQGTRPGAVAWADLDAKDTLGGLEACRQRLGAAALPPSIITETGGGLHAYWLSCKVMKRAVIEQVCKGLAAALGSDPKVAQWAALLRLPGSVNMKYPHRPVVRVATFEPGCRYEPDALREAFPAPKRPVPARPRAVPRGAGLSERLERDPGARLKLAEALGAELTARGVAKVLCPRCERLSVWFYIDPPRVRRDAACDHRKSCGWSGSLMRLARL